jgi:outer membrane protein assembly factor BamB
MRKIPILYFVLLTGVLGWSADYLRDGPDVGGTGWVKGEKIFTLANVKDTKLLWKMKLDTAARVNYNLLTPLIVESVKTASGNKQIVVVAGVSDALFGIDADTGTLLWTRRFELSVDSGRGGGLCPGGQDAVPVISPASTPGKYTVYALAGDGRLWQVNVADGENVAPPAKFMPPNGKAWALNLFKGVIYSSTGQGCGTVPYSFFSYDLATGKSSAFLPAGGGLWGRRGPAIAPDGTIYMGTGDGPYDPESGQLGNAVVAVKLNADKELKLAGYYAPKNANYNWMRDLDFNVSPMAFDYKGRHWLLSTGKECRLLLSDRDKFGGANHTTETFRTPLVCNDEQWQTTKGVWGSLGAWVDAAGTQWIYMPFWGPVSRTFHAPIEYGRPREGAVAAFKLKDTNGKVTLEPAWLSTNMVNAEEAEIANGILFTYGSGERILRDDRAWDDPPPPDRATAHATMYALDAVTGKELWNSGDAIVATNHFSGMSVANGRAYVGTVDGIVYCFGVAK